MGLLDRFSGMSEDQQQGLLAAAAQMLQQSGPSTRPTGIGQILGGGMNAYQDSTLAARKRKLEEDAAKQSGLLRGLQIQEAQGGLDDHDRARQHAELVRQAGIDYQNGQQQPPQAAQPPLSSFPMQSLPGQPQSQQQAAAQPQDEYQQRMGLAQFLRSRGMMQEANAAALDALKFKPKYSATPQEMLGADGRLGNYQLSEDGSPPLALTQGVKPNMVATSLGGTTRWDDKNALKPGQTYQHTQSPDSIASNAISRDRLNFDKKQAATGDDAAMDPLAVRMTAQQYLAGDSGALNNFGRGAQGAANLNAVRLEVAKQANAAGMSGADIAAKMAEFGGLKAGQRTAGTRSANIEIAANEVAQLAPIALDASAKVVRSGFLPFGKAQIMFDSNTNNPDMRQFAMANTALVNAYGQAMARGGSATVSDKDHARELLSTAFDQPSYAAAVAQLQKETRAAQAAPKQVRKDLSDAVAGRDASAPAAPPAARKTATLSDIAATAKASGRSTAEVTAAMKTQGYTIGGQ